MEKWQMGKMITVDAAIALIREKTKSLGIETIGFRDAIGRVLAEDVYSDTSFPPFNKSAMDGFACIKSDLPGPLKVLEVIPAGKSPEMQVEAGTCSKIMTGAEVPVGADTVIMKEFVEIWDDQRIFFIGEKSEPNICAKGEDLKSGEMVLAKGCLMKASQIAVLAGVGKTEILVYKQPVIGIFSTGSELVEPEIKPSKAQIRNSNGPQIAAQISAIGIDAAYLGILPDNLELISRKLLSTVDKFDLVIISGGVSVGDYDYVTNVLVDNGFVIHFTDISSKPGKHTVFAQKGSHYVLGLPGNPVSSFVQLELAGKMLIYNLMGLYFEPVRILASLSRDYLRKKADRFEYIPVEFDENGEVKFLAYHGSAHIHALTRAAAIMEIPLGVTHINKGEKVYVRPL